MTDGVGTAIRLLHGSGWLCRKANLKKAKKSVLVTTSDNGCEGTCLDVQHCMCYNISGMKPQARVPPALLIRNIGSARFRVGIWYSIAVVQYSLICHPVQLSIRPAR